MPNIRCVRVIEYIGTAEAIKDQLDRSYLHPGETKSFHPDCKFREVSRTIMEINPDDQPVPVDDEETPL